VRLKLEALRELIYAEKPAAIKINMVQGRGKFSGFRDLRWNEGLLEFNRMIGAGTKADGQSVKFRTNPKNRECYVPSTKAVMIRSHTSVQVIIHELGHWLEAHVPDVAIKANAFLNRRTAGESPQSLRTLTGRNFYRREEVAKPDRFFSPYVGKIYPGGIHTEVVSMGIELMWSDPAQLAADPDFFDFIWDLLRR